MIKGNTAEAVLPFGLLHRIQHIFNKYTVASGGIGDENVCDCSDELAVLDYFIIFSVPRFWYCKGDIPVSFLKAREK